MSVAHALAAAQVLRHRRDHFDRMLIAQATFESLTLLTSDERLKGYEVPTILG